MRIQKLKSLQCAFVACLVFAACDKSTSQGPVAAKPPPPKGAVTVLVTGHEYGTLVTKGPRLLAEWTKSHKWPDAIALSTGDMFAGAAISANFMGAPSAEFAKALQYKASALGNHDVTLGLDTLQAFREQSGVTFLAANVVDKRGAEHPLKLPAFTVIENGALKIGVVGLTGPKTIGTSVNGQASGLETRPTDVVLPAALAGVRSAGADAAIVLIDECFTDLAKQFEAHPDWAADLVVGSECSDGTTDAKVRDIQFYSVGDDLTAYVSARVVVAADGKRTLTVARLPLSAKGKEDADLVVLRKKWQDKLDEALGAVVGFTKTGIANNDPRLRMLVATAMRDQTKSDAALINKQGVRGDLQKGNITKASIHSLLPFVNAVVVTKVSGAQLEHLKASPDLVVLAPAKLEKDKLYQLVTTEYLYFGGDGVDLSTKAKSEPELTGQVWQSPVIEWLQKQGSNPKRPLESLKY